MNKSFVRYTVSLVIMVESFFLFITSLFAIGYKEKVFFVYFLIALLTFGLGFHGFKKKPESNVFYAKEGFVIVSASWIVLSFIGALPVFITREIPHFIDALFEIVSGFTTTGSSILSDIESLSHASLFWRSFTHWLGGMGVLVFVLAILPMAGGYAMNIMKAESPGPSVGKFVSKVSSTAKILYAIYMGLTVLEFVALLIAGMPCFDAINAALQTAGTGGFAIYNAGMGILPIKQQNIITVFMILFGINFNVYYFILIGKAKEGLKCEEMRIYLGVILGASLLIAINTLSIYKTFASSFQIAIFQVASIITTTGYSTVDFNMWPTFSKTILICLMFMGACAGSTGGGIKVSRIVIAIKDSITQLKVFAHHRIVKPVKFEGRVVDKSIIDSIRQYIVIYVLVFFGSLLIISLDNFDFATNFSAIAATLNNIGPGLNAVGPTANFASFSNLSKLVIIFDMLAGRLELIPMIILFSPSTYRHNG